MQKEAVKKQNTNSTLQSCHVTIKKYAKLVSNKANNAKKNRAHLTLYESELDFFSSNREGTAGTLTYY